MPNVDVLQTVVKALKVVHQVCHGGMIVQPSTIKSVLRLLTVPPASGHGLAMIQLNGTQVMLNADVLQTVVRELLNKEVWPGEMIVQPYKTRNVQRLRIALPVDGHGHVTIQLSGNQKMRSVDVLKMVQLKFRKLSIMCKETLVPISTTRIVLMF